MTGVQNLSLPVLGGVDRRIFSISMHGRPVDSHSIISWADRKPQATWYEGGVAGGEVGFSAGLGSRLTHSIKPCGKSLGSVVHALRASPRSVPKLWDQSLYDTGYQIGSRFV